MSVAFENSRRFHFGESFFKTLLYISAAVVLITLSAILLILYLSGQHAFQHFGVQFLWLDQWDPVRDLYGPDITRFAELSGLDVSGWMAPPRRGGWRLPILPRRGRWPKAAGG